MCVPCVSVFLQVYQYHWKTKNAAYHIVDMEQILVLVEEGYDKGTALAVVYSRALDASHQPSSCNTGSLAAHGTI